MATPHDAFPNRHIGPTAADTAAILESLGYETTEALAAAALPASIAQDAPIGLTPALDESEALATLRGFADKNTLKKQLIGAGYYDTVTPAVIRRNVLENPGWNTAYTPYQPEISQCRLEALLNFQTMVQDLTGLPIAGASLLDEATAVAEAVQMMARQNAKAAKKGGVVLLDANLHPSSINVTRARAAAVEIPVEVAAITADTIAGQDAPLIGVVVSNPGTTGGLRDDLGEVIEAVHTAGGLVTVACDLLAQVLLTSPGELGADIAVGSAQRFGVPLFFGGPHAAFMSCRTEYQRKRPAARRRRRRRRHPTYRLSLQTSEQHIRRDKATSTSVPPELAIVASFCAVWRPAGLRSFGDPRPRNRPAVGLAVQDAPSPDRSSTRSPSGHRRCGHRGRRPGVASTCARSTTPTSRLRRRVCTDADIAS